MRFCFVTERSVPEETGRLLQEACQARGIEFFPVEGRSFDFDPARRLHPGDLLYRGAVSTPAINTEQFLYVDGAATFHTRPGGVHHTMWNTPLMHERCGVPVPKTVYVGSSDRHHLAALVERVGGFPVVLKVLGRSNGIGVMLLESMPSLVSVAGYALSQGAYPQLSQFVPDATHWRLVVVGQDIPGHYKNKHRMGDFRTDGSSDPADFNAPVPPAVADAAIRAVASVELEFAGVDVLEDPHGNVFVLEANFPCYYPQAQLVAGADIAGPMVDHLAAKARKILGA